MSGVAEALGTGDVAGRRAWIVDTLVGAFAELMRADPAAFRTKFRKMAADPFAFYRGSACLFYSDVARLPDPWAHEHTARVWIQGDLHAENFGTYMNADGDLIFDVNDFDEAYLGHFTWDLQRLAASIALLGWRKAFPDEQISRLIATYAASYLDQVRWFRESARDQTYSLGLENTDGAIHQLLRHARNRSRLTLLDSLSDVRDDERRFREGAGVRRLGHDEYGRVCQAFHRYLDTIPSSKKFRAITYTIKDVVARRGVGIGSAGLPVYTVLIEGFNQALDNDVVLSMKQGNVAAPSRVVTDEHIATYFAHHGHRTAISQRALQAHADPLLGYTELGGIGYVVSELSPYETGLDWDELTEPDQIAPVLDYLGRASAKMHCVSDTDSDHTLVPYQTEQAIGQTVHGRERDFIDWLIHFAHEYAAIVRDDRRLFIDAFRGDTIPGISATTN